MDAAAGRLAAAAVVRHARRIRGLRRFGCCDAAFDDEDFEADRATGEPAFTVDLDGFEGPLDLLLELARRQKVDLARISILELAEQYLAFVEAARKLRLELAADYLVMAAWLAYLKSRLLLPAPPKAEAGTPPSSPTRSPAAAPAGADPPRRRAADATAAARPRRFRARRAGADRRRASAIVYQATLYDLLSAYARQTPEARPLACLR